jgi:hypothetical protein
MADGFHPRFKREHILRLSRLLDMLYKPSEIAEEIGISYDSLVRTYLPAGCPHQRDKGGLLWIHGLEFKAWAESVSKAKNTYHLGEGEAWCVRCNKVVTIEGGRERAVKRNLRIVQGKCSECGGKVNRLKSGKVL